MSSINFYSLGAAQEVTGSKHVLEIDGKTYMIDCGAFQGSRAEADRKNREFGEATRGPAGRVLDADNIEAVVLTHGHLDHCGLLPILTKHGYQGNVYSTPASRDLANLIMMDSAKIMARDAQYLGKQAAKKGTRFDWKPIFNEGDVVNATNDFVGLSYHRPMYIGDGVKLEFYDAGHILGSAMALLTIGSGDKTKQILCTGDLGRPNKPIIRDPETDIPAPDYLVLESTYGNRLHGDTEDSLRKLGEIARRCVEKKGKIIIPAFAIERTQELVYYFHILTDRKIIPPIPIYVDSPMATNATTIFQVHPECYSQEIHKAFIQHHKNPFGFNDLHFTSSVDESKALNKMEGPLVIISADGMCEAGRIQYHLMNHIEDPNTTILIVGYMAENTLGRRLKQGDKEVRIQGDWYKRRADVQVLNAFSAHADYGEIIGWLKLIDTSRLKRIFLVHGEPQAQKALVGHLAENNFKDVTVIRYGENYEL